jgi:hypothetical protein
LRGALLPRIEFQTSAVYGTLGDQISQ